MKREIMEDLLSWKRSEKKQCLLVIGARQTGKTYLIREFGKTYESNMMEINFEFDLEARKIFKGDLQIDQIIRNLTLYKKQSITAGKTLLFFDEIQACPRAIMALKLFSDDGRYDVVGSGSLLGVSLNTIDSFPVGYVKTLTLYPFSFKEFLWANGIQNDIISTLETCFQNKEMVPSFLHDEINKLLLSYTIVGGMPAVVKQYLEDNDFTKVLAMQKQIVSDYRNDMAKYANKTMRERVKDCFDSIPDQLAKDNKKYQYKLISQGGNARFFSNSISWICDAGLAYKTYRLKTTDIPLKAYRDLFAFKLYCIDTGLLLSMYDENMYLDILQGNLGVFKGGIFENLVFNMLHYHHPNVYYYEKNNWEIDFITTLQNEIVPIEVKSGYNTRSKSLQQFIKQEQPQRAIKLSLNNVNCEHEVIECYPLYMTMFL